MTAQEAVKRAIAQADELMGECQGSEIDVYREFVWEMDSWLDGLKFRLEELEEEEGLA